MGENRGRPGNRFIGGIRWKLAGGHPAAATGKLFRSRCNDFAWCFTKTDKLTFGVLGVLFLPESPLHLPALGLARMQAHLYGSKRLPARSLQAVNIDFPIT